MAAAGEWRQEDYNFLGEPPSAFCLLDYIKNKHKCGVLTFNITNETNIREIDNTNVFLNLIIDITGHKTIEFKDFLNQPITDNIENYTERILYPRIGLEPLGIPMRYQGSTDDDPDFYIEQPNISCEEIITDFKKPYLVGYLDIWYAFRVNEHGREFYKVKREGHINSLIYNFFDGTLTRFETYGYRKTPNLQLITNIINLEQNGKTYLQTYFENVTGLVVSEFYDIAIKYPGFGPQYITEEARDVKGELIVEGVEHRVLPGYCMYWSTWFIEFILTNYNIPILNSVSYLINKILIFDEGIPRTFIETRGRFAGKRFLEYNDRALVLEGGIYKNIKEYTEGLRFIIELGYRGRDVPIDTPEVVGRYDYTISNLFKFLEFTIENEKNPEDSFIIIIQEDYEEIINRMYGFKLENNIENIHFSLTEDNNVRLYWEGTEPRKICIERPPVYGAEEAKEDSYE